MLFTSFNPFAQNQRQRLKAPQRGEKDPTRNMNARERYDFYSNQIKTMDKDKAARRDGSKRGDTNFAVDLILRSKASKGRDKAKKDLEAEANNPGAAPGTDASKVARGPAERPGKRRRKGRAALRIDAQTGGVKNDGAGSGVNVPQK